MFSGSSARCKAVARKKDEARKQSIRNGLSMAGPGSEFDRYYLNASAAQIVLQIRMGNWSAGDVVRAFVRRAALAQRQFNCLTEICFESAIEEADALDMEFAQTKKIRGRLHGVPVSLKDQFDLTGFDSTCGHSRWDGKPAKADCNLVDILRAEGAIIIAKTNMPQTGLSYETTNPVFGRTLNPWKPSNSSGGSSGGEAALLAVDGSALGFGTDTGGSLRIPAAYCGIYSFKPTAGRITDSGARLCSPNGAIPTSLGPMARTVDDLDLAVRVTFGRSGSSSDNLAPVQYRPTPIQHVSLRFGYYTFDGCVRCSPATERAVLQTVKALRAAGHECVEFVPPDIQRCSEIFIGMTSSDAFNGVLWHVGADPLNTELKKLIRVARLPKFLRRILGWFYEKISGDRWVARTTRAFGAKSAGDILKLNKQRQMYRTQWAEHVWDAHRFDGIIAPSQAVPAVAHGSSGDVSTLTVSTFLFNVLDYPVGSIPVSRVHETMDDINPIWLASEPRGGPVIDNTLYNCPSPVYNSKQMHGLPLGVQVVGRTWEDEKTLSMMRIVDDALGERRFGPGAWEPTSLWSHA